MSRANSTIWLRFGNWLQSVGASPRKIGRKQERRFRLDVEQLETRAVPSVTLGYPGNQTSYDGDPINVIFLAQDSAGYPVSLSTTGLPAGLSVATLDSSTGSIYGNIASNADASGPYTVTVTGTAADGSMSQSFTWYVLQPTVTFYNPGDQSNFDNDTVYLGPAAYENAGHTLTYSATNLPTGLSINSTSGLISGTLTNASLNGPYTVTLTATDSAANVSGSTTFNWAVNAIVTMTYPGNQENQGLDTVNIPLSATVSNGDTPTFTASGLPSGLSVSGGAITGTIAENDGADYTNSVTITATDPVTGASATAYFNWQVDSNVYYNVNTLTDTGSGKFNVGDLRYCISSIDYSQATASNFYINSTIVGTISLNGSALPALAGKNFTIDGSGLTVDAGDNSGIFVINSDATAEIDNIDLTNAANDFALVDHGPLTLNNSDIDDCTAGGFCVDATGTSMTGNSFQGVSRAGDGGAGFVIGAGFVMRTCTFENDSSTRGNGGAVAVQGAGDLQALSCTFTNCTAAEDGGAIYNQGTLTVSRQYSNSPAPSFTSCTAQGGGGGAIKSTGTLTVSSQASFGSCYAGTFGGAIYATGQTTIDGATFQSNNSRGLGGALYVETDNNQRVMLTNAMFVTNTSATIGGGAIAVQGATTMTIGAGCSLAANSTGGSGGGLFIGTASSVTVQGGGVIAYNSAGLSGGGISNAGRLTINDATLDGNTAASCGGGLNSLGTSDLTNTSIQYNSAGGPNNTGGGGICVAGGVTTTVSGCLVSGNTAPLGAGALEQNGATLFDNPNANQWDDNIDSDN
jgi:predicted outer membrane repeat protein